MDRPKQPNKNDVDSRHLIPAEFSVFWQRWYILSLFGLVGMTQALVWNGWGTVSDSMFFAYPGWDNGTIALLGNWGNIMYIVPIVPVIWFFEAKGLRASIVLTGVLMSVGTLLRCLPLRADMFTM